MLLLAACHLLNVFNYYCVECIWANKVLYLSLSLGVFSVQHLPVLWADMNVVPDKKKLLPLSRRQNIAVESRAAGTVMFTCVQRGTQLVMSISVIINSCHLHLSTTLLVILCWLPTLFAARSSAILQPSNPHHSPADGSCRLVYSRRSKTIDVSCIPAVVITALSLLSHSAFYKVKCLNEVNVRNCTAEVLKITRVYLSDN